MESSRGSLLSWPAMAGQMELSLRRRGGRALSVTQLVRLVQDALEAALDEYWVVGEVSNARLAPSGHLYLTLKDARSALAVVMFRSASERLRFKVADGMQLIARGRVALYEPRGALQFYAEELEPRGLGALQIALEQLKERLAAEGLFDSARKRPLPFLPRTIAIVTALRGAAVRDMLTVIQARNPNVHLFIYPVRVQGAGAGAQVARALDDLNRDGRAEVIIVGRGGGSLEDLWAFNEEIVARAIYRSAIPVISAVGHEIDYTIADFVADARAPTPTGAAQIVIPSRAELGERVAGTASTLYGAILAVATAYRREVSHLARGVRNPSPLLRQARQHMDETGIGLLAAARRRLGAATNSVARLSERLREPRHSLRESRIRVARLALHLARALDARAGQRRLAMANLAAHLEAARIGENSRRYRGEAAGVYRRLVDSGYRDLRTRRERLAQAAARLDSLSPLRVLERGYAVVSHGGNVVNDAVAVQAGEELDIRLRRGRLRAVVRSRTL